MKSFIKQPKKNDSTTSSSDNAKHAQPSANFRTTTFESMTPPTANHHKFTPTSSPKMQQFPQYTPPTNVHLSSTTTNSPKKLLTPIKNLFSSTKSAGPTPNSNDNLQSLMVNGASPRESKTSRLKKHIRSRSNASIPTLHDMMKPPARMSGDTRLKSTVSSPSLQELDTKSMKPLLEKGQNEASTVAYPLEIVEVPPVTANLNGLGPPILLSRGSSKNFSIASSAENDQFHAKQVFLDAKSVSYINDKENSRTSRSGESSESSDDNYDSDDDDRDDDDNSSQFSFVQDMKAGRNTSVKYYKTNVSKPKLEQALASNSFDENDLGGDAEDMMDYDFENNGLGEDDEEYDDYNEFDGENAAYNDMFSNEDIKSCTISNSRDKQQHHESDNLSHDALAKPPLPAMDPTFGDISKSFSPETKFRELTCGYEFPPHSTFNTSHHLSIQGPPRSESHDLPSSPRRASVEDDILENYLDRSTSNSIHSNINTSGDLQSPLVPHDNQFELYDVSSPVINGLTIGHNLSHRSGRKGQNPNRSLIHRNPVNVSSNQLSNNGEPENINPETEQFIASFHGSFDEGLNNKIKGKVDDFESWQKLRRQEVLTNSTDEIQSMRAGSCATLISGSGSCNTSTGLTNNDGSCSVKEDQEQINAANNGETRSQNRSSVAEMMGLLSSLELSNPAKGEAGTAHDSGNRRERNSVAEMMGLLSSLEPSHGVVGTTELAPEVDNKKVRSSVDVMMNFLASVGDSDNTVDNEKSNNSIKPQPTHDPSNLADFQESKRDTHQDWSVKRKPSFKRYSWFSSQESLTMKGVDPTDDTMKPPPLDQDVLDEINRIPMDFDYEEHDNIKGAASGVNSMTMGFERSNSYNRKPRRVLLSNQAKSNKIETSGKTVTFYDKTKRPSPAAPPDFSRVKNTNVSRGSSFRSVNSITSVTEENENEEDVKDEGTASIPVHVKIGRFSS
ncbi:hypothetical protein KGF57_003309 [Candida theae]|uniref:Zinc-regulated protein 8 n=1 Tax=Candida theae TaxID=1198502 RepID=A0AAD5BDJ3_9ASCO|nr:uncharacterized protein KGF57_003309 [Candida theae]KAI5957615.1 hypothetical protein KGF57_003309 [Candida theae]